MDYYYGDFYPLTPYSLENNVWIAWQFNMPESGEGMVQVFRRPESETDTCIFTLHGLAPESDYKLNTFDVAGEAVMSGGELMETGLAIPIKDCPGAAVVMYERVD